MTIHTFVSNCLGGCLGYSRREPAAAADPPPVAAPQADRPAAAPSPPDIPLRTLPDPAARPSHLQKQLLQALPRRPAPLSLPPAQALHAAARQPGALRASLPEILDAACFEEIPLRRVGGTVLWLNRDLLQRVEPEIDWHAHSIGPELERSVLERYGYIVDEALLPGAQRRAGPAAAYGLADRYRLTHSSTRGSGRAVHLPGGESSKGAGATGLGPLHARGHTDGRASLKEAMIEALAGEICHELSGGHSTRVVAVVVPDLPWPRDAADGNRQNYALIIRVGAPPRPAHFLRDAYGGRPRAYDTAGMQRALARMFGEAPGRLHPRILQGNAALAARMQRHGLLHGTLDEANMGLFGSALDFGTLHAQPRSAPIFSWDLRNMASSSRWEIDARIYGSEQRAYRDFLMRPLDIQDQWKAAWRAAKDDATLAALGLPPDLAGPCMARVPESCRLLAKHVRRVGRYFYSGYSWDAVQHWDQAVSSSAADVFRLRRDLASFFFAAAGGEPPTASPEQLFDALDFRAPPAGGAPVATGWHAGAAVSKYAVAGADDARAHLLASLREIALHYPVVMRAAADLGIASGRWHDERAFLQCAAARARFENRPLDVLFNPAYRDRLEQAAAHYLAAPADGRDGLRPAFAAECRELLERALAGRRRSVDGLLYGTPVEAGSEPGTWRLQPQTVRGATYYLEAAVSGACRLCVEIPVASLHHAARAVFIDSGPAAQDTAMLKLSRPVQPYEYREVGDDFDLQGVSPLPLYAAHRYVFAVPDAWELAEILRRHAPGGGDGPAT